MRTCWMLQVGMAVGLLASLGVMGQTSSAEGAEATKAEYEVFSAYISEVFVGAVGTDRVGRQIAQIVIGNKTESDKEDLRDLAEDHSLPPGGVEKYLRKEVPSLRAATIRNFHRANEKQAQLAQHFDLPLPYQFVSAEMIGSIVKDAGSWPEYCIVLRQQLVRWVVCHQFIRGHGKAGRHVEDAQRGGDNSILIQG